MPTPTPSTPTCLRPLADRQSAVRHQSEIRLTKRINDDDDDDDGAGDDHDDHLRLGRAAV